MIASFYILDYAPDGKKERRWYDERYREFIEQARSFSWIVTTVAMFIVWIIIVTFEGPGLSFFLMTGLWIDKCGVVWNWCGNR